MATRTVFLTTTGENQTWIVPSDFDPTNNTIRVIGAGAGAGGGNSGGGGGGAGAGAYAEISNLPLIPGTAVTYHVGAKGTGGAVSAEGTDGGDTWFNGDSLAASSCGAKGGKHGSVVAEGEGGLASASIGTAKNTGGNGGRGGSAGGGQRGGGGGGGAAGPHGDGADGGDGAQGGVPTPGGGGGGADGGSPGGDDGGGP